MRWLPGLGVARGYERAWLRPDLAAGVVLAALLVPQGMGYAEASGMPAVTGLYATVACLLGYAVFGPSRHLVLGPDSSLTPLIAAAIVPLAASVDESIALGGALAIIVGGLCIAAGAARLGTITELMSGPVRLGYLAGLAVIVILTQLPKLLGFSIDSERVPEQIADIVTALKDGLADPTTVAVGVTSLIAILVLARLWPRFPGVLLVVVCATAITAMLDLAAEGVAVVGTIPSGFPTPAIPRVDADDLARLFAAAVGITLVAMADTSALSKSVAHHGHESVDANREVVGLGAANLAAGLFQGFAVSASSSRTAVAEAVGARTQLAGVAAAGAVLVLLVAASGWIAELPQAALAAVVISAVRGFVDVKGFRHLWDVRQSELVLATLAMLAVMAFGPLEGIGIAVLLSLGNFVRRAWRPHDAVLGRIDGRKGYHDMARHPEAHHIPGLLVYRFDAPLFFANADHFTRRIAREVSEAPERVRWVVIAAEPITDIDTTAATELDELLLELEDREVQLAFAELKGPVKDQLERYGLVDRVGSGHFYPTLGTAVSAYVDSTGVPWVDWQERDS